MVTWKKSHNGDPQVLGTTVHNSVVRATGCTTTTDTIFCKRVLFQILRILGCTLILLAQSYFFFSYELPACHFVLTVKLPYLSTRAISTLILYYMHNNHRFLWYCLPGTFSLTFIFNIALSVWRHLPPPSLQFIRHKLPLCHFLSDIPTSYTATAPLLIFLVGLRLFESIIPSCA